MKALYSTAGRVPLSRVLREYRAALLPLAIVLALNLVALVAVVWPLSQRVTTVEQRADAAESRRATAQADLERAQALQETKVRATQDLDTFYKQVLPANVGAARRILQLKLRQQAAAHDVEYQGGGSTEEELSASNLLRLTMSMRLTGSYEDIRGFIHDLETSPDFVVIEEVSLSDPGRGETGLAVALQVSTYYRNAAATITPTPGPAQGTNGR
jgi:Tfp pilus assembly protein PilO